MESIQPLWSWGEMPMSAAAEKPAGGSVFTDIFKSAVANVQETDSEVVELQTLMASGELDDPAKLTIADYKATVAVDLLVQLRNRALDAYSEIMRISL